jgi:hypothetical protein
MKILVVGPANHPIVRRLVANLENQEHEVLVVSHGTSDFKNMISIGERTSIFSYMKFNRMKEIEKKFKPDVVHAHVLNGYGLLCLFLDTPLLVALWGSDVLIDPFHGKLRRKLGYKLINFMVLKKATWLHTSSLFVAEQAQKQYYRAKYKTSIFYWGFELKKPLDVICTETDGFLKNKYKLCGGGLIVFSRGLSSIYNPEVVAKIINLLISMNVQKKIVVLRGLATSEEVSSFLDNVDSTKIILVNEMLEDEQLYCLYKKCDIHVSIPKSDSLGGGVIEPALLGSYPILSALPSYKSFLEKNEGYLLESFSDKNLALLVYKIKDNSFVNSEKNIPLREYQTGSVIAQILAIYGRIIKSKKS